MSLSDKEILEMGELAVAYQAGRLSDAEHARLEGWLLESEAAREEFVRHGTLTAGLCGYADESVQEGGAKIVSGGWPRSARWAVAACIAGVLAVGAVSLRAPELVVVEAAKEATGAGCAVLTKLVDASWAEGATAFHTGETVPVGEFRLASGLAQLEFYTGATLVVEGEAELELRSPAEVFCTKGAIRAQVPHHAKGFKVGTPEMGLVDLGTEFALRATPGAPTEVHVIDGEVEVHGSEMKLVTGGQAVSVRDHGRPETLGFAGSGFAGMREMAKRLGGVGVPENWEVANARLVADPKLIAHYRFEPAPGDDRLLQNVSSLDAPGLDGAIVGARWGEGRWPGKRAAIFKSPGDRVRLDVSGSFDAISLAAWVQVDGLDRFYNSLFLTDGFAPGNPHWQIGQDGRLILGVCSGANGKQEVFYSPPVFGVASAGQWVFLVSTFDAKTGEGVHFVNGEEVVRASLAPLENPITIGPAELGNWGLPVDPGARAIRNLNGKIDVFSIFADALTPAEVSQLYRDTSAE